MRPLTGNKPGLGVGQEATVICYCVLGWFFSFFLFLRGGEGPPHYRLLTGREAGSGHREGWRRRSPLRPILSCLAGAPRTLRSSSLPPPTPGSTTHCPRVPTGAHAPRPAMAPKLLLLQPPLLLLLLLLLGGTGSLAEPGDETESSIRTLQLEILVEPPEACSESAALGDTLHIHYTGSLEDGRIVDTSLTRDPLVIELGQKQVIPERSEGQSFPLTWPMENVDSPHLSQGMQCCSLRWNWSPWYEPATGKNW
ncbi:peptidyl-prolyl cis-trans isomerase FKBP11 isoform X2 [Vombatus ursinus]|uniref:peptidyl-prolyl cis-trans isomerase FKBP11 isoform X2 n=1 Tax=Vombatus ursinus TaxID=29139 RepID=UPI000FFCE8FF|nr:peptidyl-prolyl cis-trans isomerase FKBP11 isoform X2 [Vombatus ursinus]